MNIFELQGYVYLVVLLAMLAVKGFAAGVPAASRSARTGLAGRGRGCEVSADVRPEPGWSQARRAALDPLSASSQKSHER